MIRETNAWRHENSVIHQGYAEHLASSAEILAENAALKDQIAVSDREFAKVAAGGDTHARKLTSKVKHVLGHNDDAPSGGVGTVGGGGGGGGGSGVGDSFEGGASGIPNKQHRSPDSRVFFPSADGETPRRHTTRTRGQEGHGQKGRLQQLQQLQQLRQLLQQERNEEAKAKAVSDARETLTKFSSTSTTADNEPLDRAIEAEGADGQDRRDSREGAADSRRSSSVASIGTDTVSVLSPSSTSSAAARRREFVRKGSAETLVGRWSGSEPVVEVRTYVCRHLRWPLEIVNVFCCFRGCCVRDRGCVRNRGVLSFIPGSERLDLRDKALRLPAAVQECNDDKSKRIQDRKHVVSATLVVLASRPLSMATERIRMRRRREQKKSIDRLVGCRGRGQRIRRLVKDL